MKNLSLFDLTGKKALVTGGSVGIGRACATALAMGGADVAIVDINEQVGNKTVADLKDMGVDAFFVHCDVSDKQQVQAMTDSVVERFGRLDIAINNAGIGIEEKDEIAPQENWDKVIGINLTGVWLCAQAQAQQMIQQTPAGGKIINLASMLAKMAGAAGPYCASKAGVVHLSKSLAAQWGRFNINVNSISPSYLLSPMHANSPMEFRQRVRELTPMGYMQRPEDLYGPVLFLASEASNYITGHDLLVDGGHTLNVWLSPLEREVPPRVSPEEEAIEMKKDLLAMEIPHDVYGVRVDS